MTKNINDATAKIIEAQTKLDEMEIEYLTDTRNQLSEFEKSLNQFTTVIDSLSPDLEDANGDKWNDKISFDKIKRTQDTLAQLITKHRRNLARENQEREIEREHKRSKEIEVQDSQHREELSKLLHKFKTSSEENEPKTVKLSSLRILTFDGEPTKWKSYWQQFEATIHNSKKLDD